MMSRVFNQFRDNMNILRPLILGTAVGTLGVSWAEFLAAHSRRGCLPDRYSGGFVRVASLGFACPQDCQSNQMDHADRRRGSHDSARSLSHVQEKAVLSVRLELEPEK